MHGHFEAAGAVGVVAEASGEAAGSIAAVGVPVLSVDRAAAGQSAGRWVVVLRSARAGVPQSAGQRVAVSLQARRVMLPCGGLRVTSQLVPADRTRTSIVVRTFMAGPTPIMAGVLLRQVSRPGPLLAPRQPPHTTTRTTRNPIIHLTAGHLTRRPTPRTVPVPIRTAAMCKVRRVWRSQPL